MKPITIFIVVFILLLVIGGLVAYFIIEKPAKDKAEKEKLYNNLSINAFADGKQIVAFYTIFFNGSIYVKGTTLANDYILQQVEANQTGSIYVKGTTLANDYILQQVEANQTYDIMVENPEIYTKVLHMNPTMLSPIRVNLEADKIGSAKMVHNGTFWQDNPLNLTINVQGMMKNPILCFRWSINLIDVSIEGLNVFDGQIPKRLNADKCYYLNSPINDTFLTFPVSYKKFGALNDDSIKVLLFDGDITSYSPNTIIYEDIKGNDIFVNDIIYVIK